MLYLGHHAFFWWNENIRVGDYCLDINKSAHTKIKQQKTNASIIQLEHMSNYSNYKLKCGIWNKIHWNADFCLLSRFWLSCFGSLVLLLPKLLNYLAFESFDFERTSWRLFQKRVVRTKFDIYVFIFYYCPCSIDYISFLNSDSHGLGENFRDKYYWYIDILLISKWYLRCLCLNHLLNM